MNVITVIVTGGTFSKVYDPDKGELVIRPDMTEMIKEINKITYLDKNINFNIYSMIGKDSLYINDVDRENLSDFIYRLNRKSKIIVIHGTDNIDITCKYLQQHVNEDKTVVLTGSMVPYSINPIEAVSNYVQAVKDCLHYDKGVYISMHGVSGTCEEVFKDRSKLRYNECYFAKHDTY